MFVKNGVRKKNHKRFFHGRWRIICDFLKVETQSYKMRKNKGFSRKCFIAWISCFLHLCSSVRFNSKTDTCEKIDIPMCKNMPYNMTRMPNLLHHSSQENAKLAIEQFQELIDENCSDVLQFFLCAMYAPICTVNFQKAPIPPCRRVCERARAGCERIVNDHNVSWPEYLDCSRLPRYDLGVCVLPEAIVSSAVTSNHSHRKKTEPKPSRGTSKGYNPSRVGTRKTVCRCSRKKFRPQKKKFKKGKYDFAIRGQIEQQGIINSVNTVSRVHVLKVYKQNAVKIAVNRTVDLWTNSTCVCPKLLARKQYLLIGYEDKVAQRLLFLDNCLATRWQSKWGKRIQKWNKVKKSKRRRKCRKQKGKRCRKSKGKSRRKTKKSRGNRRFRKKQSGNYSR